jgi:hypothetical protein
MDYRTPAALESAIKDAARLSGVETDKAITLFWWDRFLTRVFASDRPEFALKGGLSILARMGTRYTKDIDLAAEVADIAASERKLIELASLDFGDFFRFPFNGSEPIKPDADYRVGKRLSFGVVIGAQRRGTIKVDLVVGCMPVGEPERVSPAHRLYIKGLSVADYFLYPIADTVADKLCATLAIYPQGRRSSRVKDLADLVAIATTTPLDAATLRSAINSEAHQRGLRDIVAFSIPDDWRTRAIGATYRKVAKEAGIPELYHDIETAEELARNLVEPVANNALSGQWNPSNLRWEDT